MIRRVATAGYKRGGTVSFTSALAVITGANGSGKSTIGEAITFGLAGVVVGADWTKSRLARAALSGPTMYVELDTDAGTIRRRRVASGETLKQAEVTGPELAVTLDVDVFALSPSEQGNLLLGIDGADGIDAAIEAARAERNRLRTLSQRAEAARDAARKRGGGEHVEPGAVAASAAECQRRQRERQRIDGEVARLLAEVDAARRARAAAPVGEAEAAVAAADAAVVEFDRAIAELSEPITQASAKAAEARDIATAARAMARHHAGVVAAVQSCAECPTCTQPIDETVVLALADAAEAAEAEAQRLEAAHASAIDVAGRLHDRVHALIADQREARARADSAFAALQRARKAAGAAAADLPALSAALERALAEQAAAPAPDLAGHEALVRAEERWRTWHEAVTAAEAAAQAAQAGQATLRSLLDRRDAAVASALAVLTTMLDPLLPRVRVVYDPQLGVGIADAAGERFGAVALSGGQRALVNEAIARTLRATDSAAGPRVVVLEVDGLDADAMTRLMASLEFDHAMGEVGFALLITCHPPAPRGGWQIIDTAADIASAPMPPVEPRRVFEVPANPHRLKRVVAQLTAEDRAALLGGDVTPSLAVEGFVDDSGRLNEAAADAAALLRGEVVRGVKLRVTDPPPVWPAASVGDLSRLLQREKVAVLRRLGGDGVKAAMVDQIAGAWAREGIDEGAAARRIEDARELGEEEPDA